MKKQDLRLRFVLISGLVFTIAVSPLAVTSLWPSSAFAAAQLAQPPIQFTPNVAELRLTSIALTAQMATVAAAATLSLAPGQAYSETNKPKVSFIEGGDEGVGYGPTEEDPSVYLIWTTDDAGTHYYTVGADSDQLRGTRDPVNNSREENGFVHVIEEYKTKAQEVSDQELLVNRHQNLRMTSHGGALGAAIVGGLICGVVTGGACYVAFGVVAVGAWLSGAAQNAEKVSAQEGLDRLQVQLGSIEDRLRGKFDQTIAVGP